MSTTYDGYKVADADVSDEAIAIIERWLDKRSDDGFCVINCARGTDYDGAERLWAILPAKRGESRGYAWEQRAMDTLRNLRIWRVIK